MIKHTTHVIRNTSLITLSLLLSVMALYPVSTSAEELEVGYGYTKTIDESVFQIALDSSGNSYQAGGFGGTTDFDAGTGSDSHTAAGSDDIFLTKLNADGTYEYTKTMGGLVLTMLPM
jgi:hypothetical protein